jgi:ATP-dependent protease ClpP protease subunit
MNWFACNVVDGKVFTTIGDSIGTFGMGFEDFAQAIGSATQVYLTIDSNGGDGNIAEKILHLLKGRNVEVLVKRAHSSALVIALAGRRITIEKGGTMMTHSVVSHVCGNSHSLRMAADSTDKLEQRLNKIIAQKIGQPVSVVADWHRGDKYFSDQECLALGLVDEIVEKPTTRIVKAEAVEVPDCEVRQKGPQEILFARFLTAFGKVAVSNKAEFGKRLYEWFTVNVQS